MATNPKLYGIYLAKVGFFESSGFKIRPIIIVSQPHGRFQAVMAIPVSTQPDRTDVDILLNDLAGTGLLKPSVARIHRLSATASSQILEEIGVVNDKHQQAIRSGLLKLFELHK